MLKDTVKYVQNETWLGKKWFQHFSHQMYESGIFELVSSGL